MVSFKARTNVFAGPKILFIFFISTVIKSEPKIMPEWFLGSLTNQVWDINVERVNVESHVGHFCRRKIQVMLISNRKLVIVVEIL